MPTAKQKVGEPLVANLLLQMMLPYGTMSRRIPLATARLIPAAVTRLAVPAASGAAVARAASPSLTEEAAEVEDSE